MSGSELKVAAGGDLAAAIVDVRENGAKLLDVKELGRSGDVAFLAYLERGADGGWARRFATRQVSASSRVVLADSIDGLVNAVNLLKSDRAGVAQLDPTVAYVGSDAVSVFFHDNEDDVNLREAASHRVVHRLETTKAWDFIMESAGGMAWTQQELVSALRVAFGPAGVLTSGFLGKVRSLKISAQTDGRSDVGHQSSAMSQQVQRQAVMGDGGDLPETVVLSGWVYESMAHAADNQLAVRFKIECAVTLNLVTGKFTLDPLPGEMVAAQRAAQRAIGEMVEAQTGLRVAWGAMLQSAPGLK